MRPNVERIDAVLVKVRIQDGYRLLRIAAGTYCYQKDESSHSKEVGKEWTICAKSYQQQKKLKIHRANRDGNEISV